MLQSLLSGGGLSSLSLPWYAYAAAAIAVSIFVQTIAKVAADAVKHMELEQAEVEAARASPPASKRGDELQT